MGKRFDSFEQEVEFYRRRAEERIRAAAAALSISPAVITTEGKSGEYRYLFIMSPDTVEKGRMRLTRFGVDGPYGHDVRDSSAELVELLADSYFDTIRAASEDEVIAWTSTPAFADGVRHAAFVQAINTLYYQCRALPGVQDIANDAHRLWSGGHKEQAIDVLEKTIKTCGLRPNPCRSSRGAPSIGPVENPAWVTRQLAASYDTLQERVPPQWLPRLSRPKATRGRLTAALKEYGCGSYGCVLPTLDETTVLKITTDVTEAQFATQIASELAVPIVVEYRLAMQLSRKHRGDDIFLLWRESADNVGGMDDSPLIDAQHRAAQAAYLEIHEQGSPTPVAVRAWQDATAKMAKDPELAYLAKGMLKVWHEQGVFFGDVHGGNVGQCMRDGKLRWVIIDPGHVSVVWS